ncbi:MAG: IS3 family transposase [Gemmatimonadaceae bacterium]
MSRKRRQFSREFKVEAIRLATAGDRSVAQVARELGVNAEVLRSWKRQLEKSGAETPVADVFPGNGKLTSADEELRRLRRENAVLREERDNLKKSDGLLRQRIAMRYAFIRDHASEFRVQLMCRVLEVSRAGYYAWKRRGPSQRAQADCSLTVRIRTVHVRSRKRYGSPRVHRELKAQGIHVSEKRVARVMRTEDIRAKQPRKFRVTTDSSHAHPVAPNVLDRHFSVPEIIAPNRVWASDITYIPTREGWLYLAVVLDLFSRRVVGWSMKHMMEKSLTLDALTMALDQRNPGAGILHHSDRGSQYACGDYRTLLRQHGIECSMSRKGDCWDNAVAESFFATLKRELVHDSDWLTREGARAALFEYLEVWYNRVRRHSSIGYVSPADYEAMQATQAITLQQRAAA